MNDWTATQVFIAQYAFAFAAALCGLLLSKKTLTLRVVVGQIGKYGLMGGTCAPILAEMNVMPAAVGKTAKLLFWSAGVGSGTVTVPMLRNFLFRFLGAGETDESVH